MDGTARSLTGEIGSGRSSSSPSASRGPYPSGPSAPSRAMMDQARERREQDPIASIGQQSARRLQAHPPDVVDLVPGRGPAANHSHRPVADPLRSAGARAVSCRGQLGAQHATEAGLFLHLPASAGLVLFVAPLLTLGKCPVQPPGPVDDQYLAAPVLADTGHDPTG